VAREGCYHIRIRISPSSTLSCLQVWAPSGGENGLQDVATGVQKHGIVIEYQMLPCLDLSKSKDKLNHVPIELCTLLEGQMFPKANLDKNSGRILKGKALIPASNRRNEILDLVNASDGPCR
jgi:eukaryotic translation initiation factor 2C